MGRQKVARVLAAAGVAVTLALTSCAGSRVANNKENSNQGSGGMIAQLTFPAETDASIGGLVNYNPYAPKQITKTWLYEPLMIQSSLDCKVALARHRIQVGGREQAGLRHP